MSLRLDEARSDRINGLADPALERVRQDNPAARSLPLLSAIAQAAQTVTLSLLDELSSSSWTLNPCRN